MHLSALWACECTEGAKLASALGRQPTRHRRLVHGMLLSACSLSALTRSLSARLPAPLNAWSALDSALALLPQLLSALTLSLVSVLDSALVQSLVHSHAPLVHAFLHFSAGRHRMTLGFGPFKPPTRGHLWKQVGRFSEVTSGRKFKVTETHAHSVMERIIARMTGTKLTLI